MDKGLYTSAAITPGGFVDTTSAKMPVCFADKVAVEATGTNVATRNFVSLETKLAQQDESLETIAKALNVMVTKVG